MAPIIIYDAGRRKVATVSGLGPWPRRASVEFFQRKCGGQIPEGLLRAVVPGAPDAWITALERFGTMGFAEVAAPAIELARDGFPMGPFVAQIVRENEARYRRWPTSAPIFLPGLRAPGSACRQDVVSPVSPTHDAGFSCPRGRRAGDRDFFAGPSRGRHAGEPEIHSRRDRCGPRVIPNSGGHANVTGQPLTEKR